MTQVALSGEKVVEAVSTGPLPANESSPLRNIDFDASLTQMRGEAKEFATR